MSLQGGRVRVQYRSRQMMERIVEISRNENSPKDWGDTMEKIQYWYPEGIHLIYVYFEVGGENTKILCYSRATNV